jgi:3-dehydroquinate synthase
MESQKLTYDRHSETEILIGKNIFHELAAKILRLRTNKKVAVLTNENVAKWYLQPLVAELRTRSIEVHEIVIQDGEKFKTSETAFSIISRLCELGIDRGCPLVSLGGGVIGDIGGFVASIFKRGLPFIQVPTSLLAMVDASIGGKTGINLPEGKNLIGTFYQPVLTAIDISHLTTLPLSQLSYGLVEAVKHGCISDSAYYRFILKNLADIKRKQLNLLQRLVRRSIHIKKSIVQEDEMEKGTRALLNLGHTFGHALEAAGSYRRLHHGEAVGIGMLLALKASQNVGILAEDYTESLIQILSELNLPTKIPNELENDKILNTLNQDKKKSGNCFSFILPQKLGEVVNYKVPESEINKFLSNII